MQLVSPEGASGEDIVAVASDGRKIVGELKTTNPYQPGFGAKQRSEMKTGHLEHKIDKASKIRPRMAKTLLSMHDLRRRALAEIRQQPGCHNVQDIAINRVIDDRAENNWSLCVLSAGVADANTAARAALYVQSVLRRDYDLMTD